MATKEKKKTKGATDENKKTIEKYSYTDKELERIKIYNERVKNNPIKFKLEKKGKSGNFFINLAEEDNLLGSVQCLESFATSDLQLQTHYLTQLIQTFPGIGSEGFDNGKLEEFVNNAMMILHDISPKDLIEGMLAIQMIGVHNLAMETIKRAMIKGQTFEGKQANVNQASKMLRTYIAGMETLKKYRTGGHQKVTVEHVNVHKGGQAIVGSVNHKGGRGKVEK